MPARKLPRTDRGRNRIDRPTVIEYRTRNGTQTTRRLTVYRVRLGRGGALLVDGYDSEARAELTFDGHAIERLTDIATGRVWQGTDSVGEALRRLLQRRDGAVGRATGTQPGA